MTSFDVKLIEMLAFDVKPNPLEVKRGASRYWNDLAVLMGIDLAEEMAIIHAFQEEANELNEGDSPIH